MDIKSVHCPGCGAPISETGGKYICQYCGREVIVESKKLADISNTIEQAERKTQEVLASGAETTQLELRRIQLTQELSMLQMQLSNLRSEKRNLNLVKKKERKHKEQIKQIEIEESDLNTRINYIRSALNPPKGATSDKGLNVIGGISTIGNSTSDGTKNSGITFILAWMFGIFGAHRFSTGHKTLGFVYLFTFGLFTLGYFFDLLMICFEKYKDSRGNYLSPMSPAGKILAKFFTGLIIMSVLARMGVSDPNMSPTVEAISSAFFMAFIIVNADWLWGRFTRRKQTITN